jgi:hypothetical protein
LPADYPRDQFVAYLQNKITLSNEKIAQLEAKAKEYDIDAVLADEKANAKLQQYIEQLKIANETAETAGRLNSRIPDAPFKDNWYHIALRRAIKEAIDKGYDRVYLPTGDTVADRYKYQRPVRAFKYQVRENGHYDFEFED